MPHRPLGEEEAAAELLERRAHFLPGLPATYQSGGVTSLKTTQTACGGRLQTSAIVSVTTRAISSLRSLGLPSQGGMLTNRLRHLPRRWRREHQPQGTTQAAR